MENKAVPLENEQLEKVAGGVNTMMYCMKCKKKQLWSGDYYGKAPCECPFCHEIAFRYAYLEDD